MLSISHLLYFYSINQTYLPMYKPFFLDANWNNGVFMMIIFALVCVALVGILINFMMSGKKKDETENPE